MSISRLVVPLALAAVLAPAAPVRAEEAPEVGVSVFAQQYMENFPLGSVQARVPLVTGLGGYWRGPVPALGAPEVSWLKPGWRGTASWRLATTSFADTELPLSLHTRQDWRIEAHLARAIDWSGLPVSASYQRLEAAVGLGYMLRWETAVHSGQPPQPSYAFDAQRVIHGPLVTLDWRWEILSGWGLGGDLAVAPVVFMHADGAQRPWLIGTRAGLMLDRQDEGSRLGVGYQLWNIGGSGYQELYAGPVATFAWRTAAAR